MAEPFELAPNPKPVETSPVIVEAEVNQKQIEAWIRQMKPLSEKEILEAEEKEHGAH